MFPHRLENLPLPSPAFFFLSRFTEKSSEKNSGSFSLLQYFEIYYPLSTNQRFPGDGTNNNLCYYIHIHFDLCDLNPQLLYYCVRGKEGS